MPLAMSWVAGSFRARAAVHGLARRQLPALASDILPVAVSTTNCNKEVTGRKFFSNRLDRLRTDSCKFYRWPLSPLTPPTARCFATSPASSPDLPTSLRCTISAVTGDVADQLSDVLLSFGAQSVGVNEHREVDAPEEEIFADGEERLWKWCDVVAHFPVEHDVPSAIEIARNVLDLGELKFSVEPVVDEEWVAQIKASYVPLQITDQLYIIPEWSEPPVPTATNIILQPGVAFGTGEHPTTRLCLRHLVASAPQLCGLSVVDYGCGSGVLAIAALKLGAASAVCTDVDPLAVRATSRNAELNAVEERCRVLVCGPDMDDDEPLAGAGLEAAGSFDVCMANILQGPLVELAPRLSAYVRSGGQLVLSGMLESQVPTVKESYEQHFKDFKMVTDAGWAMLVATKK